MLEELDKALSVLIDHDVDMILVEYFFYIQVTKGDLLTSPCTCRKWSGPLSCAGSTTSPLPLPWPLVPRGTGMGHLLESAPSGTPSSGKAFPHLTQDGQGGSRYCWHKLPL